MSDDDGAAQLFADALSELYERAGSPSSGQLKARVAARQPGLVLSPTSLGEWLSGKSVPSRTKVFDALINALQELAGEPTRPLEWWESRRRAAERERGKNRGGRPRGTAAPSGRPVPDRAVPQPRDEPRPLPLTRVEEDTAAVLARSVLQSEQLARRRLLGEDDLAIDLDFRFRPARSHDAEGAGPRSSLRQVVEYYRALRPRRMVITGEGGSGKTVLALQIVLDLLGEYAPGDAVPVRMAAESLEGWSMEDYLVRHLRTVFNVPAHRARALVGARRILPVIDGLDEMDREEGFPSRAGRVMQSINDYQHAAGKGAVILTCRTKEYTALEATRFWVKYAAQVELVPVTQTKRTEFLRRRVVDLSRWDAVLEATKRKGRLTRELSTPWRLNLAVSVYEEPAPDGEGYLRHPDELTAPDLDVRDHLLSLYIPAIVAANPPPHGASEKKVERWLTSLAEFLRDNARPGYEVDGKRLSSTEFVMHELWPLAWWDARKKAAAILLLILAAGFLAGFLQWSGQDIKKDLYYPAGVGAICALYPFGRKWPEPKRFHLRWFGGDPRKSLPTLSSLSWTISSGIGGFVTWLIVGGKEILAATAILMTANFLHTISSGPIRERSRATAQADLAVGIAIGAAFGCVLEFLGNDNVGYGLGMSEGLLFGLSIFGVAGTRYLGLLLATRRWHERPLPWALGGFLEWAYAAGLLRVAGVAYQFRHSELQEYLAPLPKAPSPRRRARVKARPPATGDAPSAALRKRGDRDSASPAT
ncbi:NACHT domain-containing protein [Actinomadura macra]|uniref:NACHT domain-containing protein n=1 Tax=Actinomadura macra TaxID=46164 RepID=UPI000833B085|nr:NACHT domain-containing protein [Actinomadura macra]